MGHSANPCGGGSAAPRFACSIPGCARVSDIISITSLLRVSSANLPRNSALVEVGARRVNPLLRLPLRGPTIHGRHLALHHHLAERIDLPDDLRPPGG